MNHLKSSRLQKTIVSAAVATALNISATTTYADIYEFSFDNGGCTTLPLPLGTCTGPGDGLFTMLTSAGSVLQNTSYPYYGDTTWGYGKRTQIGGTLSYDTTTKAGAFSINPFEFYNGGAAVASNVTFTREAASTLMLGRMVFDWNGSTINTEIVWDGAGLFAALPLISVGGTIIDRDECQPSGLIAGLCATPASNNTKTTQPIGPVPIATSSYNVDGVTDGVGTPTLGVDDGIGGSPMDNGPFKDFNANFDFLSLTLTSFTDTTPPAITLNPHVTPAGTNPLVMTINVDTYTEPGATCTDAAPLNTNLDANVVIGGDTVSTTVGGIYTVTYNCDDASSNSAPQKIRTVVVAASGPPLIALNGDDPFTHECGITPYVDDGAICVDYDDGGQIIGTDDPLPGNAFSLDDSAVDEFTVAMYTATWSCTDSDANTTNLVRTVDVVDTLAPVVTIPASTLELVSSTVENPQTFTDPGDAEANDTCDGGPIAILTATSGTVDMTVPDAGPAKVINLLTYSWTDGVGNIGSAVRTVNVTRSQPVITLSDGMGGIGGGLVLNIGDAYTEQGMDIIDAQDGNVAGVTVSGSSSGLTYTIDSSAVDTSTSGSYEVIYNVTDSDGNFATQVVRNVQVGVYATGSNFTMLESTGTVIGGTNDVVVDWDQTLNTSETDLNFNMNISSLAPWPFNGFVWTAHTTRAFGPGTYSFDTGCTVAEIEATGCPAGSAANSGPAITMTVPDGHVGAHILFDWNTTKNIDVVNVWARDSVWDRLGGTGSKNKLYDGLAGVPPDPLTTWKLVSTDPDGDGINGSPMVDGPFQGFNANFNAGPGASLPPAPPYVGTAPDTKLGSSLLASLNVWGLFVGLITLLGLRRFKNKQ